LRAYIILLFITEYVDLTDHDIVSVRTCRKQRYWVKELQLFVSDRQSIVYGGWLTDAVIDAAQELIKERFPEIGGLQRTTLGQTLTYAVERGEFVQILNVRGNHWITISSIGCAPNHLNIYDSLPHGDVSSRAKQQIAALLCTRANAITLNFPDVQIQQGLSDCGFFSIAYALTLCTGFDPAEVLYDQRQFRNHLLQCIQNRYVTPFPCTLIKKRPQTGYSQVISIYCQCRQPENGKMAQCDKCEEWYHEECVNFPVNVNDISWFCPNC